VGIGGSCAGAAVSGQAHRVAAGGMVEVDAGPDGLPAGCVASARLLASAPVVATVVDTVEAGRVVRTAAAYNAFPAAAAGRRVITPLFRRRHTSSRLSSDLVVQNTAGEPAEVTVDILLSDGLPFRARATIAPGASHVFVPEAISELPDNRYGSATLTSSQPVVAVLSDVSRSLAMDASQAAGLSAGGALPGEPRVLPLLARLASRRQPGPPVQDFVPPDQVPPEPSPLSGLVDITSLYLPWSHGERP
jgi:hypothetical protein